MGKTMYAIYCASGQGLLTPLECGFEWQTHLRQDIRPMTNSRFPLIFDI